jgi:pyruvate/2-oxoglutarate dehydrogenase complex dihydrolipoamide acyltransferase (E2) component
VSSRPILKDCCDGAERPRQAMHSPAPVRATPDARALAAARDVDLAQVKGTGRDGLIRLEDVQAVIK